MREYIPHFSHVPGCFHIHGPVYVRNIDTWAVQFSHFSVKECLTSPRLVRSHGDLSRFYIDLDATHMTMAQACLGTLLPLGEHAGK